MSEIDSTSKFLSLILRHQPEDWTEIDGEGWAMFQLLRLSNLAAQARSRSAKDYS